MRNVDNSTTSNDKTSRKPVPDRQLNNQQIDTSPMNNFGISIALQGASVNICQEKILMSLLD